MDKGSGDGAVIVTGGAGFIGSHLADRLIALGRRVVVVDDLSTGSEGNVPSGAEFRNMDVRDAAALIELFGSVRPETVFHLAAQIDVRRSLADPAADASVNILGGLHVIEAAARCGAKKFVFSSTGGAAYHDPARIPTPESVRPNPVSPYGIAKGAIEMYLASYRAVRGLRSVALRYANVYGPRQGKKGEAGVIGLFTEKMLRGERPVIFGDGLQTRDFVFVDDVVDANIRAAGSDAEGVFHIGTGIETSVNRVAELLAKEIGGDVAPAHGPEVAGEERRSALDASAARAAFTWAPTVGLEEGITRTVEWFRTRGGQ